MVTVLALLGVVAVLFVAAVVSTREGPVMADAPPDAPDLGLPSGPVRAGDIAGVRFGLAPRGYRMAEVDEVLDRLAAELADRDTRIAVLEAGVRGSEAALPVQEAGIDSLPVNVVTPPAPPVSLAKPEQAPGTPAEQAPGAPAVGRETLGTTASEAGAPAAAVPEAGVASPEHAPVTLGRECTDPAAAEPAPAAPAPAGTAPGQAAPAAPSGPVPAEPAPAQSTSVAPAPTEPAAPAPQPEAGQPHDVQHRPPA